MHEEELVSQKIYPRNSQKLKTKDIVELFNEISKVKVDKLNPDENVYGNLVVTGCGLPLTAVWNSEAFDWSACGVLLMFN